MGFTAAICPRCSAQLQIDEADKRCYCTYCGTLVERERVDVNVSGSVKLDRSDQLGNFQRLAESAFAAGNFAEAYGYYARVLEIRIEEPHAAFRKGLCAGYLSLGTPAFRLVEVLEGYSYALSMLGGDTERQACYTEEYIGLARALALGYNKDAAEIFSDAGAFSAFCGAYQLMLGQLSDLCARVPTMLGVQRESLLSLLLHVCSFAERWYRIYATVGVSVSVGKARPSELKRMPKQIQSTAAAIAERCRADYYQLPQVQRQLEALDAELAHHQAAVAAYENAFSEFIASNPQYLSKRRKISIGGTLLVILITMAACFVLLGAAALLTPILLITLPATIVAAFLVWKRMRTRKLAALDAAFLPSGFLEKREQSSASALALAELRRRRAAAVLR